MTPEERAAAHAEWSREKPGVYVHDFMGATIERRGEGRAARWHYYVECVGASTADTLAGAKEASFQAWSGKWK